MKKKQTIIIRVDEELKKKLVTQAKKERLSLTAFIRTNLAKLIDKKQKNG